MHLLVHIDFRFDCWDSFLENHFLGERKGHLLMTVALDTEAMADLGSEDTVVRLPSPCRAGRLRPPPEAVSDNLLLRVFFLFLVTEGWGCPKESGD